MCAPSRCRCCCCCRRCKPSASPPCPSPSQRTPASKAPCAGGSRREDGALMGTDAKAISSRSMSDSFSSMAALSALKAVFIAFKRCFHRPGASIAHGLQEPRAGVGVSGRGGGEVDAGGMTAGCRGVQNSGGCESRFLVGTGESGVASSRFSCATEGSCSRAYVSPSTCPCPWFPPWGHSASGGPVCSALPQLASLPFKQTSTWIWSTDAAREARLGWLGRSAFSIACPGRRSSFPVSVSNRAPLPDGFPQTLSPTVRIRAHSGRIRAGQYLFQSVVGSIAMHIRIPGPTPRPQA